MTSPWQLRANRKNALKSTGPRSPAGRRKIRHNAVRHGLFSRGIDPGDGHPRIMALVASLLADDPPPALLKAAKDLAAAQHRVETIRACQAEAWGGLRLQPQMPSEPIQLEVASLALADCARLARYEREAIATRRKAIRRLLLEVQSLHLSSG